MTRNTVKYSGGRLYREKISHEEIEWTDETCQSIADELFHPFNLIGISAKPDGTMEVRAMTRRGLVSLTTQHPIEKSWEKLHASRV